MTGQKKVNLINLSIALKIINLESKVGENYDAK